MEKNLTLAPILKNNQQISLDHVKSVITQMMKTILTWEERNRQRKVLSTLSDYELRDIGISRTNAIVEANKPFWKE
ncbi:MAG: DUF1127 domain-containing protein [SAR324 cluster bacterium]|nr:DUF1127 domain-containing protein [SAR324 cluster bacterium]